MLPVMNTRRFYQIIKYKKYNGELGISDCKKILILTKNNVNFNTVNFKNFQH